MTGPTTRIPLLQAAFRPLFLASGLWAVLSLLIWIGMMHGAPPLPSRFSPLEWHAHEMLFGFVMAGMAGFLLTAIPNWTNRPPLTGAGLCGLSAAWLIGRLLTACSAWFPAWLGIVGDLLFQVGLIAIAARPLIAAGNRRNYPLLAPLTMLAVANLLMHLQATDLPVPDGLGWRLGLACVMVMIGVVGGRIVPAFTRNWLRMRGGPDVPAADRLDTAALAVESSPWPGGWRCRTSRLSDGPCCWRLWCMSRAWHDGRGCRRWPNRS